MRLKLILPLFLLFSGVLSAQTVKDWFTHPALAAAAQIVGGYTPQENKFSPFTLAMLRAGFGSPKDPFSVNVIFDVVKPRFLTLEAIWQPIPQIGVRAGLQKMPFLMETSFAPYMFGMIGYSQAVSALAGYSTDLSEINCRSRDLGITLQGSFLPTDRGFSWINYTVGIFNGSGLTFRDNNRAKDFQWRLVIQPMRTLRFSLGGMFGYYSPQHEDAEGHSHYYKNEELAFRQRMAAGAWYDDGKWFVRAEDIYATTDGMHSNGIMGIVGCKFLPRLQLVGRVDHFQRNLSDSLTGCTKLDICFTHHLTDDGTIYWAVQYGHTFFSNPGVRGQDTIQLCLNIAFTRML